jgi:hypothetical protein
MELGVWTLRMKLLALAEQIIQVKGVPAAGSCKRIRQQSSSAPQIEHCAKLADRRRLQQQFAKLVSHAPLYNGCILIC